MSVIDYLKKGGKTSAGEMIAGLADTLEIPQEEMLQLWELGVQKYGSEEALGEALDDAVRSIENPSPEEVKQAVASVFIGKEGETMFAKQGGKLLQLVNRFAKGGTMNCGCGNKLKCGGKAKKGSKIVKDQNPAGPLTDPSLWIGADTAKKGAAQQGILTRNAYRRAQREYLRNELGLRGAELIHNLNQRTRENADTFYGNRMRETLNAVKIADELRGAAARQEARKLIAGVYDNAAKSERDAAIQEGLNQLSKTVAPSSVAFVSLNPYMLAHQNSYIPTFKLSLPTTKSVVDPLSGKSDEELVKEVIKGVYGAGAARKEALGDRYGAVQAIVNKLMSAGKKSGKQGKKAIDDKYNLMLDLDELLASTFPNMGYRPKLVDTTLKAKPIIGLKNGDKINKYKPGGKSGKWVSADKTITITDPGTAQADTTGIYSYPSTNGEFEFTPYGRTATVWDNTGGFPIHRYADENWIMRHPRRQSLPAFLGGSRTLAPKGFFENLVERVNNRIPKKDNSDLNK